MKTNNRKFDPSYYNNEFNYLISQLTDMKRSIMDIDCVLSKYGYNTFMIDHKKNSDKVSLNTVTQLATFAGVKLGEKNEIQSFIVRSNVNTDICETIGGFTVVYEIKNIDKVKNKKEITNFVKSIYTIFNDEDLKLFFQQETHEITKQRLKQNF